VIWPWVMVYAIIYCFIRVSCSFRAELPYCPFVFVLAVEEFDEDVEGITVGSLWVGTAWTRRCYYCTRDMC
jgi:hypothetical protein